MFEEAPPVARTVVSQSNTLTLEEFVARVQRHPAVEGIVLLGSGSRQELTAFSDYDLVIVAEFPVALSRVHTYVAGRLTEIAIVTPGELATVLRPAAPRASAGDEISSPGLAERIRWLRTWQIPAAQARWGQPAAGGAAGAWQILFDRAGRLTAAESQVRAGGADPAPPGRPGTAYAIWFDTNFRWQHTKRLLAFADATALTTLDLRLQSGAHLVLADYFRLRGLPWPGDKEGIRYLTGQDPAFLELLRACLAAADRASKAQLFEQLMQAMLAPAGGLWPEGVTAIQLRPDVPGDPETVGAGLAFWESLVTAPAYSGGGGGIGAGYQ